MSAGTIKIMGEGIQTTVEVLPGDDIVAVLNKVGVAVSGNFVYMQGDRTLTAGVPVNSVGTIAVGQRESNG